MSDDEDAITARVRARLAAEEDAKMHSLGMDGYCFTCQRSVCIHGMRDYIEPSTGKRWQPNAQ